MRAEPATERVPATGLPRVVTVDELVGLVGQALGPGSWVSVTQDGVNAFAAVTGDEQWIHTDARRAARGPFGTTIAHGYLTLSLCSRFLAEILRVSDASMAVNYGLERVRFPSPVLVGTRVRCSAAVKSVKPVRGGVQAIITMTVEAEDAVKPACVAEVVVRYQHPRTTTTDKD